MKTKIGIGITFFDRPDVFQFTLKQIEKHTDTEKYDVKYYLAADSYEDRRGVAYRKNECLRNLKDCDYIFLFDEDCFPIDDNWIEVFINAHKATGNHHFIYQHETAEVNALDEKNGIVSYDNCNGCMMFLTKETLSKVGAFSPNFGLYGYEHANYSNRVHMAGLTPYGRYICPKDAYKHLYSLDIDDWMPELHKQLKFNNTKDFQFKLAEAKKNAEVYMKDNELYYPL